MKIGDTVRFLSEVGGGRVSGFKGKDIVLVEDEDGFEIPMLMSDVVVIEEEADRLTSDSSVPSISGKGAQQADAYAPSVKPSAKPAAGPSSPAAGAGGGPVAGAVSLAGHDRLNLYLSFLPIEVKELSQTSFEMYLVNDSNYFVQVLLMNAEGAGWHARFCGTVEPNSKLFIEEFDRSVLNDLERLCLQTIAWKPDKTFTLKPAVSSELRLDLTKFYKLHIFQPNEFFRDPNWTLPFVEDDKPLRSAFAEAGQVQQALLPPKEKPQTRVKEADQPKPAKPKKKVPEGPIEVNLHIEELMDTTAGLSAGDMLMAQMNEFRRVMDENIKKTGQQIVFIHGKGEGVLRKNILQELKYRYKGCTAQDASFREYGFGATLVKVGNPQQTPHSI
ncbi:MAG: DUF2027 domain-containing protein [Bacteroidaceae bacterium]|nr:DUF2027 domain-containing protein [Bacteroidaceae bacterium]